MKKELIKFLTMVGALDGDYLNQDYEIIVDFDVNDCLIYMYFYMMSGDDKYYQTFHEKYSKLNKEQQEIVKNDYINIINAQDEIYKVKRKGEMKYE